MQKKTYFITINYKVKKWWLIKKHNLMIDVFNRKAEITCLPLGRKGEKHSERNMSETEVRNVNKRVISR